MSYYYSKSLNAFLDGSLQHVYQEAGTWPSDAIEAPDEMFQAFAINQAPAGKVRGAGEDGLPVWTDAPTPSNAQLVAEASAERSYRMQVATTEIAPLQDAVDLDDATDAEKSLLMEWKQYRVALNRIEQQAGYPADIDWPVAPQ